MDMEVFPNPGGGYTARANVPYNLSTFVWAADTELNAIAGLLASLNRLKEL